MAVDFPAIADHYGPDGAGLNKAAPCLVFEELREPIVSPLRGGQTWDRMVRIRATIWMPDPVAAEGALESLLRALNALQHGRAAKPEEFVPSGGAIGDHGAKYTGVFSLRITVNEAPLLTAVPESSAVNALIVTPAGTTEDANLAHPPDPGP